MASRVRLLPAQGDLSTAPNAVRHCPAERLPCGSSFNPVNPCPISGLNPDPKRRYRKELLAETHQHLASQLEADGNWRDAEKHYLDANDWKGAVGMFRAQGMWDDALRVARAQGGANASKQVREEWSQPMRGLIHRLGGGVRMDDGRRHARTPLHGALNLMP